MGYSLGQLCCSIFCVAFESWFIKQDRVDWRFTCNTGDGRRFCVSAEVDDQVCCRVDTFTCVRLNVAPKYFRDTDWHTASSVRMADPRISFVRIFYLAVFSGIQGWNRYSVGLYEAISTVTSTPNAIGRLFSPLFAESERTGPLPRGNEPNKGCRILSFTC